MLISSRVVGCRDRHWWQYQYSVGKLVLQRRGGHVTDGITQLGVFPVQCHWRHLLCQHSRGRNGQKEKSIAGHCMMTAHQAWSHSWHTCAPPQRERPTQVQVSPGRETLAAQNTGKNKMYRVHRRVGSLGNSQVRGLESSHGLRKNRSKHHNEIYARSVCTT